MLIQKNEKQHNICRTTVKSKETHKIYSSIGQEREIVSINAGRFSHVDLDLTRSSPDNRFY